MSNSQTAVNKFLDYIDQATNFGLKSISGNELFRSFSMRYNLSPSHETWLRAKLEYRGIL